MYRRLVLAVCAAAFLGGCAKPDWSMMESPQKPVPGPELQKLACFVGTWTGTAEMVTPSPEEMKAAMPEGSEEMPTSYAGGGKYEWGLGGMFLRGEGWHEMGEGLEANYVEYWTWDPKAKKYRTWYFSDWGESGDGWLEFEPDGKTLHMKGTSVDADGASWRGGGTITFTDDDSYNWTWSQSGRGGKLEFKGTSKRQP